MQENDILKYEPTLPSNFTGTFYFSNPSDEDFVGVWNSKEYLFKAGSMTPMIMPDHSPLEIQHIRKKFAKDLAEREFYKSKEYKKFKGQETNNDGTPRLNSIHQAGTYSEGELVTYIQKCLDPLPTSELLTKPVQKERLEDKIHRDDSGNLTTEAVDSKTSLRAKALNS